MDDTNIQLNPPFLGMILTVNVNSNVDIFTHGSLSFPGFTDVDQLNVLVAPNRLMDLAPPTTSLINPMAHLIFKICWANICPRSGGRSNLTWQDVVVCARI